jgi:GTP-binding protein
VNITSAIFVKGITGPDSILRDLVPEIAFIGRSNVGKSSTINSLLGQGVLARTGKKQGKTREINFFKVNDKMYFVDLPGYGFAQGGYEDREAIREMILEYFTFPGINLRTVALIIDGKVGLTEFDRDMLDILRDNGHRVVVIMNKMDRLNQKETSETLSRIAKEAPDMEVIPYSAITKAGKDRLLKILIAKKA